MQTSMTLVYPINGNRILLGLKKLRIGAGTYVGFGGRVGPGETIKEAAIRELQEESGLAAQIDDLHCRGILIIHNPRYSAKLGVLKIHIFTITSWEGEPHSTEEMDPCYFEKNSLPWDKMRESEHYWLPAVLNGRIVNAEIVYDKKESLISFKLSF